MLNDKGDIMHVFGSYLAFWKAEKAFPFSAKAMFHQVHFMKNDSLKKVAALSSHLLDIIDVSKSFFVKKRVLLHSYNYVFSSCNIICAKKSAETLAGANHFTATENYIYIIYSPNSKEQKKQPAELHICDWDGVLHEKQTLDFRLKQIVAKNDHLIYGITGDDEPKLVQIQR